MQYLKRAWYCASWSYEITRQPMARTILDEQVLLYRKEDGSAVAIGNICPHRFAPLNLGELRGDAIQCPYHGLRFDHTGACVLNPHDERISPSLKVKAYPIVERHRAIWIWMGEPGLANPALVPDCSHHDNSKFRTIFDRIPVPGNYELVSDNLLDLTHIRFLHKSFVAPKVKAFEYKLVQDGQTVRSIYNMRESERAGIMDVTWPQAPELLDIYVSMRWNAPANLTLTNRIVAAGSPEESGVLGMTSHLITPETATSSHYFWATSRDYLLDDAAFERRLHENTQRVITDEDAVMIGLVQRSMGQTGDIRALRAVILPTDGAAMRARLILGQLLKAENGASDMKSATG